RQVSVEGRPVSLSPTEYEVLRYLALHAGKPVTHTTLLRQVWGEYAVGDRYNTRYVVAQLRRKLGDDPSHPRYIASEGRTSWSPSTRIVSAGNTSRQTAPIASRGRFPGT